MTLDRPRRTAVVVLAALLTLLAAAGPAAAAPVPAADVYQAIGVDTVPGDYVVMVDVSGSMDGDRYDQLRAGLTAFFAALAPDDQVTLIPFAESAPATTRAAGRSPGTLVAGLPDRATGRYTDIGTALEKAVDVLQRKDAPSVATVVLLTDGQHDPGPGSAYPFTQGYQWDELTRRARALHKSSLVAYAVPLAGATGAPLLGKVFSGAEVLDPARIDRLTAALDRPKAAARAAKARTLLAADAAARVRVTWPTGPIGAGKNTVEMRLTSTSAHVPLELTDARITSTEPGLHVSVPTDPITLPPGGSVTVPVTADWDAGGRRFAPLATVTRTAPLTFAATVGSPWSDALTGDIGLDFAPALDGAGTPLALSAQRGSLAWWLGTLAALLLAAGLTVRARRHRLSPPLSGTLRIDPGTGDVHLLPLTGRSTTLDAATADLPGHGTVTATRPSVSSPDIALLIDYAPDGTATTRETRPCPPGTSVIVAGVGFSWEPARTRAPRTDPPLTPRSCTMTLDVPISDADLLLSRDLTPPGGRGGTGAGPEEVALGVRCGRPLLYPVPVQDLPTVLRRRAEATGCRYAGALFAFDVAAPRTGLRLTSVRFQVSLADRDALAVVLDTGADQLGLFLDDRGEAAPSSPIAARTVSAARVRDGWLRRLVGRRDRAQPWTTGVQSADFGWVYEGTLPRAYAMHALLEIPGATGTVAGTIDVRARLIGTGQRRTERHPVALRDSITFDEPLSPADVPVDAAVRLCMAADVAGYSRRGNAETERIQRDLVTVLDRARVAARIRRETVAPQPQGDGQFTVLPVGIDEGAAIPLLVRELADGLRERNAGLPEEQRMRLRVALHRGLVKEGANGWIGSATIAVHRILDSPPVRDGLAVNPEADFVLGVPDVLYQDVIRHAVQPPLPGDFRAITVDLPDKGFIEQAWLHIGATTR